MEGERGVEGERGCGEGGGRRSGGEWMVVKRRGVEGRGCMGRVEKTG